MMTTTGLLWPDSTTTTSTLGRPDSTTTTSTLGQLLLSRSLPMCARLRPTPYLQLDFDPRAKTLHDAMLAGSNSHHWEVLRNSRISFRQCVVESPFCSFLA